MADRQRRVPAFAFLWFMTLLLLACEPSIDIDVPDSGSAGPSSPLVTPTHQDVLVGITDVEANTTAATSEVGFTPVPSPTPFPSPTATATATPIPVVPFSVDQLPAYGRGLLEGYYESCPSPLPRLDDLEVYREWTFEREGSAAFTPPTAPYFVHALQMSRSARDAEGGASRAHIVLGQSEFNVYDGSGNPADGIHLVCTSDTSSIETISLNGPETWRVSIAAATTQDVGPMANLLGALEHYYPRCGPRPPWSELRVLAVWDTSVQYREFVAPSRLFYVIAVPSDESSRGIMLRLPNGFILSSATPTSQGSMGRLIGESCSSPGEVIQVEISGRGGLYTIYVVGGT